jgi:Thaumatin family
MERRRRNRGRGRWVGGAIAVALVAVIAGAAYALAPGSAGPASQPSAAVAAPGGIALNAAASASASDSAGPSAAASASRSPSPSARPSVSASPSTSHPKASDAAAAPAGYRTFTIVNAVSQTVWVASNPNTQHPLAATGWVLAPGQSVVVKVPDGWGGRIWGRTGCSFDADGTGHCATGDCDGRFQCEGSEGGATTLGEFTLNSFDDLDFYDVSMVDGANLPMYITTGDTSTPDQVNAQGCSSGGCTKPVVCPSAMTVAGGACESPCAAFDNDMYCCRGTWAGRADCDPSKWTPDYALVFKDAEPYAYSYSYDDSATMSCKGECDYRITFGVTPGD